MKSTLLKLGNLLTDSYLANQHKAIDQGCICNHIHDFWIGTMLQEYQQSRNSSKEAIDWISIARLVRPKSKERELQRLRTLISEMQVDIRELHCKD